MFSEMIKDALSREVVGQPHAIASIVRGVTRLASGMTPRERSWCAYLLLGPPGTGRAHLVRTLSRLLHGEERIVTVSCNPAGRADPWSWFVEQLYPLFAQEGEDGPPLDGRAPRVVLIQDLEGAPPQLFPVIARVLETGELALPGGGRGHLHDCLVFLISGLCTREILDETPSFGFTGSAGEDYEEEQDAIYETCRAEAEKVFGLELLAQLDRLIVFRRLDAEHLASVLDSHFGRMSRWLARRGVECELEPAAREFLVSRGSQQELLGARDLVLAHRREVEFPLADLLLSRQLEAGVRVRVDRRPGEEHLHFAVEGSDGAPTGSAHSGLREIPVS